MGIEVYFTAPPEYHRLPLSGEALEQLVALADDNCHLFIDRRAVEELARKDTTAEEDRVALLQWLAHRGEDELYFSLSV